MATATIKAAPARCRRIGEGTTIFGNMGTGPNFDADHNCRNPRPFGMPQESARRFFRRRSGSPWPRRASTATWVLFQTGTARASNLRPFGVNAIRRLRRSDGSVVILSRPRRRKGLRAAVSVVGSIASSAATAPMVGGAGRFRDIINENCPFVRPIGLSASSKRRAKARAARCT